MRIMLRAICDFKVAGECEAGVSYGIQDSQDGDYLIDSMGSNKKR